MGESALAQNPRTAQGAPGARAEDPRDQPAPIPARVDPLDERRVLTTREKPRARARGRLNACKLRSVDATVELRGDSVPFRRDREKNARAHRPSLTDQAARRHEASLKTPRREAVVYFPWQRLYFLPEPQGQGSLRPTLSPSRRAAAGSGAIV